MKHDFVPLGNVASFIRGVTFKPDDVVSPAAEGAVACMRTKNVQQELSVSDVWGISADLVKRADQYLSEGDVLVSSANSWNLVGKCCAVPPLPWQSTFGGFVSVLRPQSSRIDPRYLFHWFASDRIQKTVRSFGQQTTNISNLNTDRCLKLMVPLPPLPEQRRIAEILDNADALRAKRRAALAQLSTLARSIFLDMFGDPHRNPHDWCELGLGELIVEGPQNGLYKPESSYGAGTSILRIDGFYNGEVSRARRLRRVRVSEVELSRYGLRKHDIVINRVNSREYLGKSALIRSLDEPIVFESNMMRFAVDGRVIEPEYLISALQTQYVRSQILQRAKDAVNQSSINQEDVKAIVVAVPPLALQQSFARAKHSAIRYEEVNRRSLAKFDALFASLQHRAFRGEL